MTAETLANTALSIAFSIFVSATIAMTYFLAPVLFRFVRWSLTPRLKSIQRGDLVRMYSGKVVLVLYEDKHVPGAWWVQTEIGSQFPVLIHEVRSAEGHTYRPRSMRGQGMVEYALALILVLVVIIVIIAVVSPAVFNNSGPTHQVTGQIFKVWVETPGTFTYYRASVKQANNSIEVLTLNQNQFGAIKEGEFCSFSVYQNQSVDQVACMPDETEAPTPTPRPM